MDRVFTDWQAAADQLTALGQRFAEPALRTGEALVANAERNVEALSAIATEAGEAWWQANEAVATYWSDQGRGVFKTVFAEAETSAA